MPPPQFPLSWIHEHSWEGWPSESAWTWSQLSCTVFCASRSHTCQRLLHVESLLPTQPFRLHSPAAKLVNQFAGCTRPQSMCIWMLPAQGSGVFREVALKLCCSNMFPGAGVSSCMQLQPARSETVCHTFANPSSLVFGVPAPVSIHDAAGFCAGYQALVQELDCAPSTLVLPPPLVRLSLNYRSDCEFPQSEVTHIISVTFFFATTPRAMLAVEGESPESDVL